MTGANIAARTLLSTNLLKNPPPPQKKKKKILINNNHNPSFSGPQRDFHIYIYIYNCFFFFFLGGGGGGGGGVLKQNVVLQAS